MKFLKQRLPKMERHIHNKAETIRITVKILKVLERKGNYRPVSVTSEVTDKDTKVLPGTLCPLLLRIGAHHCEEHTFLYISVFIILLNSLGV